MGQSRRKKWRIYQFLSSMGAVKSKDEAAQLARAGKICVDGTPMTSLHYQIDPRKEKVTVNGKHVELKENRKYFVLNKPEGVVCTKAEIIRFFDVPKDVKNSLTPVGRLDKNTTGLLIVTNDGRLARRVLDPLTKRYKWYAAKVDGILSEESLERLRKGVMIELEDNGVVERYKTLPAKVHVEDDALIMGIVEGKKRQVRKMCEAVRMSVKKLHRFKIANLELPKMKGGEYKEFSKDEMYALLFE